jgi:anti-sigma regulatory factor (Ser/Thr protein kinase)
LNGQSSRGVIERVVNEVQHFATGAPQSDDITLLVLGYTGPMESHERTLSVLLKNDLAELQRLNQLLEEFADLHGVPSEMVFRLTLVMEEILTNVISYGYEDEREHEISVRLLWENPNMKLEVDDDGRPFNPLEAAPPDMGKPLAERQIGGLGIHLVREMMDEFEYRRKNNRNIFILKTKIRET